MIGTTVLNQVDNLVEENKVDRCVMRFERMRDAYRETMTGHLQLTVMLSVITVREEIITVIVIVRVKGANEPTEIVLKEMKKYSMEGGMSGHLIVV